MTGYEIPFQVGTPQSFNVSLGGITVRMTVRWNIPAACWVIDIRGQDGEDIALGLAMTTGDDLLGQLEYLGLGGLFSFTDHNHDAPPTFANLGADGRLFYVPAVA